MQIIRGLEEKIELKNPVITIGNFDGVHIGHQRILDKVVLISKQISGTPMAITFEPHPMKVLAPERALKMLVTFEDKVRLLSQSGLQALMIIPFDKEFSQTEPESFIKNILVDKLGIKWLIVGHNFSFGKRKKGNTNLLRQKARKYGFGFSVVRHAIIKGNIVSSSKIRSLIQKGNVDEASEMLGRYYHVKGIVVKGTGRGAEVLNIPTANINCYNEILPKDGVYAVRVTFASSEDNLNTAVFLGAANIGKNPTFGDIENVILEVHLIDFKQDILGKELIIHFIDRIRDEKRFSTVEQLRRHIDEDINMARKILRRKRNL